MKAALVKTDVKEEGVQVQTKVLPRVQNKGIDRQVVGKGRAAVGGSTSHVQDDDKPILDYMLNQKNIVHTPVTILKLKFILRSVELQLRGEATSDKADFP